MKDIIEPFKDTYGSEEAYNTIAQIGDVTIDTIIDGGLLDGVPLFGTLRGIYKATKSIQMRRLTVKLHKFFFITQNTTLEERIGFMQEYTEKSKEEGYEALLAVIDRLDNVNKVDIITNLMNAKIREYISINDFIRLCVVVDRIPYPDFDELHKYTTDYYEDGSTDTLLSAGVLFNTIIGTDEGNKYRLNSLGEKLLKYGLLENIPVEIKKSTHLAPLDWAEITADSAL